MQGRKERSASEVEINGGESVERRNAAASEKASNQASLLPQEVRPQSTVVGAGLSRKEGVSALGSVARFRA